MDAYARALIIGGNEVSYGKASAAKGGYRAEMERNLDVCPKCGYHNRIGARRRLDLFLDPEPRDEMMFSKSGSMVVWIDREEPNRPCRIEFDLSFGTLVASLKSAAAGGRADGARSRAVSLLVSII